MEKVLIIPDMHQNPEFIKLIRSREDFGKYDRIVFLGDYFDAKNPAHDNPRCLKEVCRHLREIRDVCGNKTVFLWGNHDLPYYALRPGCGGRGGDVNLDLVWSREFLNYAELINAELDDVFWESMQGMVLLNHHLISHAGLHPLFWPRNESFSPRENLQRLLDRWNRAVTRIPQGKGNPLFQAGKARGGELEAGGPLWLDWNFEFEDGLPWPQIVGHTPGFAPRFNGRSQCIDCLATGYGILADRLVFKTL